MNTHLENRIMKTSTRRRSSAVLLASLVGLTATAAETPSSTTELSKITISEQEDGAYAAPDASVATKTPTPIMQTATKVEVLTPQALRDMGLGSQDLGRAMATLGIAGLGMGDLGDMYFFRGFQTGTTLWNGFRIEEMGSAATNGVNGGVWMTNVERMELLRGASSVLYGRAEPGGAISILTKKPLDTFSSSVDAGVGAHDDRWVSADLGGPLNAGKTLLYRLGAGYERSDSWYTYGPSYRSTGVAPALEYRLSAQTRLTLEGQFRNVSGGSDQPYIPVDAATNALVDVDPKRTLMPGTYSEFKQRRAMLGADHRFNDDWSLSWKYMYNDADSPRTIVNWTIGMYYPPGTPSGGIEYTQGLTLNQSGQKVHATLLELTGRFTTGPLQHTVLFGADYYKTKSFQNAGSDCWCNNYPYFDPPPYSYTPGDLPLYQYWTLDEREWAVYAQDQIQLPRGFHLLVGGRYQRQKEHSVVTYPDSPDFNEDLPYKRNLFLPRASLLWQPTALASLYYSFTENAGASQGLEYPGTPLKPEFSKQHEIGAKLNLMDSRLLAQAAVFRLTKENIASGDPLHPGYNVGVGRVRSTGYELSLQGALGSNWNVLSTYNYARPYVEIGSSGAASLQPQYITAGTLLPYVSQRSFTVLTSYRLPFEGLQGWKIGGGYNWFSAPTMNEESSVRTASYGVASAFVSYEALIAGLKTAVQLNVDNLFDEKYLQFQGDIGANLAVYQANGYTGGNYVGGNWGSPRKFRLGLRIQF
jgi:iron complex outermembrane receptor protein